MIICVAGVEAAILRAYIFCEEQLGDYLKNILNNQSSTTRQMLNLLGLVPISASVNLFAIGWIITHRLFGRKQPSELYTSDSHLNHLYTFSLKF